jgi:hypothetical protein
LKTVFYDLPATIINPEVSSAAIAAIIVRKHSKTQWVSEQRPLHIRIYVEGDYLAVQNDYQRRK